jgi:uncharacterized protein (TIGR02246 family)
MKTSLSLIGAVALAGTGLVIAGNPQQPAAAPAVAAPQLKPAAPTTGAQPAATTARFAASTPEEKSVMEAVEVFSKTYSAGDHAALTGFFTDDAVIVDPEGNETRGKAAIGAMYGSSFRENPGLKLESEVAEVRFITPDVARVEGQTRLSSANGDATEFTRFSSLLVKKDGKWRSAEIREYTAPAEDISPYERLRDLEWMVGHWVDESETNKVEATVCWADNQSYLVRTYTVEVRGEKSSSGTMFIGWDPQSGQIKSWLFDSEGGHGEGLWTRTAENQWVVKAQGVLRDGRPNSATQVHTILNKDSVKSSSIDRIIGGQVAPDIVDLVMVRKPPQPAAPAAGAAAPK